MIKLTVNASRKYNVLMERGSLAKVGEYIPAATGCKVCIVTDSVVDELYGQADHQLWKSLAGAGFDVYKYVFSEGEASKNMSTVTTILEFLAENEFTRSDLLLALGGGVVGDIAGFTAATYLRGIDFIQIPTTLLAVVDSSVGGKTGVNLSSGKNLAGAFYQPSLVLFDPDVLDTLSVELKLDGMAEAIKAGVIGDESILETTSKSEFCLENKDLLTEIAAKAVEVKRMIVEEDEKEVGKRALLNLGHTAAHAIEKCSDYTISHGHAVAMGLAIVTTAAKAEEWCDDKCYSTIMNTLNTFGFSLTCPYNAEELAGAALHDKKRKGDEMTLVIPKAIENCQLKKIPIEELLEFFAKGLL